jgi:murein DD-endopeptidase MepM/ murein hydrolase activator NlpD
MRNIQILLYFFFLVQHSVCGQEERQLGFRSPLDGFQPTVLTAGFGEIRPNHFHMGLDFRTAGREGLKIRAVERGYIARIVVSPQGYGKVLYVNHSNGITSVYAHCSDFNARIDSLVKAIQLRYTSNEVDVRLTANDIPVERGEEIAFSGNTGNSSGPHLHFELRDTESQDALNPLTHGFYMADHQSPKIHSIKLYALNEDGFAVPGKELVVRPKNLDTLHIPAHFCSAGGGIGFAVEGSDFTDKSASPLGLYAVDIFHGAEHTGGFRLDRISFETTRLVNAHCDHDAYTEQGKRYHKCFHSSFDPLSIYPMREVGVMTIYPETNYPIRIKALDAAKNSTELNLILAIEPGAQAQAFQYPESFLYPNESIVLAKTNCRISIPKQSVIYPLDLSKHKKETNTIGYPILHRAIDVSFPLPSWNSDHTKYYIEVTMTNGKKRFLKTYFSAQGIEASSTYAGIFTLKIDDKAPHVSALNFVSGQQCTKNTLTWRMKDNETAIRQYDLYVNGIWMAVYYDSKNDVLEFNKPVSIIGTLSYRLRVKDWCGNEKVLEGIFTF